MSQKTVKTARKVAEKTAKNMAFNLAKAQMEELINSPFKVRFKFCIQILFRKKSKVTGEKMKEIQKIAHGSMNEKLNETKTADNKKVKKGKTNGNK